MKAIFKSHRRFHKVFLFILLLLLYPGSGFALDNDVWNSGFSFHFYPPGARALGMGGAFVGLADDASAAASNPAGLAQLTRTQLAIEGKYVTTDSTKKSINWSDGGLFSGRYSSATDVSDDINVSFGAVTTPVFNNFLNVSVFYDKPISFSSKNFSSQTFDLLSNPLFRIDRPSKTEISMDEVGLSIAKSFADGKLMLGAGVGLNFFNLKEKESFTLTSPLIPGVSIPLTTGNVDESDVGISARVGILVRPIEKLRFGISYTMMPRFDYNQAFQNSGVPLNIRTSFDVPDNLSFGAAYNIFPNWVVIAEGRYILYSQLMKGFVVDTFYFPSLLASESNYSIDNVMEFHLGTEYVLKAIQNVPIAFRAGLFYEPAHDIQYRGPNPIERRLFDGGEDLMHYTVGLGAVFYNHFQVDAGADFTERNTNVSLSMVYQF